MEPWCWSKYFGKVNYFGKVKYTVHDLHIVHSDRVIDQKVYNFGELHFFEIFENFFNGD